MDIQSIKQRFGIIGNSPLLERSIDIARQVAPTDLTALITGESGSGKEVFPKIIHQFSSRKHGSYIAVNCGAIPEGTIDSELFGHEKGSFTGAHEARKGYFEVLNGGTIFLDEVAELPLSTQVRLLRVLESGEFIKVGSSKVLKTDVRVVAASNKDIHELVSQGKFREDLFYRLNTVPILIPPLRHRKEDISLFFRRFAIDFAEKYRMPALSLEPEAEQLLANYRWPGNIRQLKNTTEQISIIEKERVIDSATLLRYLPEPTKRDLPVLFQKDAASAELSEREILYKVLFDMKRDINELKKLVTDIIQEGEIPGSIIENKAQIIQKLSDDYETVVASSSGGSPAQYTSRQEPQEHFQDSEVIEESLSIQDQEKELILKALEKYRGRRKNAAKELGISERTLYRKIKEYNISK